MKKSHSVWALIVLKGELADEIPEAVVVSNLFR
jgi:hypothetical protein